MDHKKYSRLIALLLLVFFCFAIKSQSILNRGSDFERIFCDTIKFNLEYGKIILPIQINGRIEKFILDTGAPTAVFESLFSDLELEEQNAGEFKDGVGNTFSLRVTTIESYKLGNTLFKDVPAVILDRSTTEFLTCFDITGLIGSNSLRNCIVQIDMKNRLLIISNDLDLLDVDEHSSTPMLLDEYQSMPYVQVELGEDYYIGACLDSGDPSFISISNSNMEKLVDEGNAEIFCKGYGKTAVSLGVDTFSRRYYLNVDQIGVGESNFINSEVFVYDNSEDDRLGLEICNYGIVTIDYINGMFGFKNYESTLGIDFIKEGIGKGFNIYPDTEKYIIGIVWEGSPADKLNLHPGQEIVEVNGIDFSIRSNSLDCYLITSGIFEEDEIKIVYVDSTGDQHLALVKNEK